VSWKHVDRVEAMKIPDSPPVTNIETNAIAFSIGTVKWIAAPKRAEPVEGLTADGTANHRRDHEARSEQRVHPAQHGARRSSGRRADDRERHRVIAEKVCAREIADVEVIHRGMA
jgi:hypothetical protein